MIRKYTSHISQPSDAVKQLVEDLGAAIAVLPIEKHVEPVEILRHPTPKSVSELQIQAEDIIWQLNLLATYGSHDAIRVLRDLGKRAAESLLSYFPDTSEAGETRATPPTLRLPPNQITPRVRLNVGMGPVYKIILGASTTIRASSKDEILAGYASIAGNPDIRIRVEVSRDGPVLLPLLEGVGANNSAEDFQTLEAISAVETVVARMVESRLSAILAPRMHEAADTVASYSLDWPIPVPAMEDGRPGAFALVGSLGLGKILPFRLARKGGSGSNRDFSKGPTALAMGYCVKLFITQLEFATLTANDCATLISIDKQLDLDRRTSRFDANYSSESGNQKWNWDRWSHWKLKAALLPDYPKARRIRNAVEQETFNLWLNAAMLLAESDCNDDWEHYSWPVDIEGQGDRSSKAEVRQILRKGMKNLRRDYQEE